MGVLNYFSGGLNLAKKAIILSLINIAFSLIDVDAISQALGFRGFHIGFKLSLPSIIVDLWDLVSLPGKGGFSIGAYSLVTGAMSPITAAVISLMVMFLMATVSYVYLRYLTVKAIGVEVRPNYARILDLFVFELLVVAIALLGIPLAVISVFLGGVVYMVLMLIIYYFIYATPFLIVIYDKGVVESLKQSRQLARELEYFSYTLVYILITVVLSSIFTVLVVDAKMVGLLISLPLIGAVGLWLATSTTLMILKLTRR